MQRPRKMPSFRWRSGMATLAVVAVAAGFTASSSAAAEEDNWVLGDAEKALVELGKHVFFDADLSKPKGNQSCASCHDPKRGWTFPDSEVNKAQVVANGAKERRKGGVKTPANAYASFSIPFQPAPPAGGIPLWQGGNFWDGRAEGCGSPDYPSDEPCPLGPGAGPRVLPEHLPFGIADPFVKYLGPTTDQALNPMPSKVEQNLKERKVCKRVRDSEYAYLYTAAYGEDINCANKPKNAEDAAYKISFKRLALAMGAWQASPEVNSFSSKRDDCIRKAEDDNVPVFPCRKLSNKANLGHDVFYGLNDTGRNRERVSILPFGPTVGQLGPVSASCAICHNGVPAGEPADPDGVSLQQLYSDNRYHNLGIPYNPDLGKIKPKKFRIAKGQIVGLSAHTPEDSAGAINPGEFRTTTLRNVGKGASKKFVKAYMHNGYLKSLEQVVKFYNTATAATTCLKADENGEPIPDSGRPLATCPVDMTAEEAIANDCWPEPEFPEGAAPPFLVGDLGLTCREEKALVTYMKVLSDKKTPKSPF